MGHVFERQAEGAPDGAVATGWAEAPAGVSAVGRRTVAVVRYLMLIYGNEDVWNSLPPEQTEALIGQVDAFNARLRESGELIDVQGLETRARSVRTADGAPVVTDGPYLEAKEFVGSYFVVDVAGDERAMRIATAYPGLAFGGGIEVWPLMEGGWRPE